MGRYIILLMMFSCFNVIGQEYFANTRSIRMKDGLSHYKVLSFYPSEKGMWIGTIDGLNYYDGFNWLHWKKEDKELNFHEINFILQDQKQQLWLFNTSKLWRKDQLAAIDILEPESQKAISFEEKFADQAPFNLNSVEQFFEDDQHRIYIFADQQLWRYSTIANFEAIPLPPNFKPIHIFSNGTFLGSVNGAFALSSSEEILLTDTELQVHEEYNTVKGNYSNFNISLEGEYCVQFKLSDDGMFEKFVYPVSEEKGIKVVAYHQEQFWIYEEPDLTLVNQKEEPIIRHPIHPRIGCTDKQGNLWVGAYGITIIKPQRQKFVRYLFQDIEKTHDDTLFRCRGMVEKNGELFVSTYNGLQKIDLKTGNYTLFDNKARKFVAIKDRKEHLWFANRELYKWDQSESYVIDTIRKEPIEVDRIWSMFIDQNEKVWIGDEGLSYVEQDKIKSFDQYNGYTDLENATVLSLSLDKNGVIWVVSNNGLYILDTQKGIVNGFGKAGDGKNYLPTNKFQHILQDSEGIYWLATEDIGLLRWNKARGEWQVFDKSNGFLSNNIYAVYEDDYGYLWMSSFNGLMRMDKESYQVTVYHEIDGISNNEFNRISHLQLDDGRIFFGSQNGITAFHPKDFVGDSLALSNFDLDIKHISIFGSKDYRDTFPDGSKIDLANLKPNSRVIDLELSCNDLFWPGELAIHYSLERLNTNGTKVVEVSQENISPNNHVELFGMTAGNYNLKVKAIRNNGKQLGETFYIPLNISQPLTQTPAFRICALITLSLMIWGFLKLRTAHLRKRKVELEKLVKERTSQILKDQKTIKSQAEQIAEMREQLSRKDELWLEELESIINERLEDTNLDLPSIIENLDIGRSQFFEKVKLLTKMTPNQYIQELRLNKAKNILESGDVQTVKEVAFAVGIKRPGYFSKLFKDRFGILPSEYFRRHNN